jgi:hypothetical protein
VTHPEKAAKNRSRLALPVSVSGMPATGFHLAGVLFVVVSIAVFAVGTVVYLAGNDVALLLAIIAFAGFVSGIGLLAAARATR